VVDFTNLYYTR